MRQLLASIGIYKATANVSVIKATYKELQKLLTLIKNKNQS
ncbi:hypothetical protein [Moraxella equi]|nr:hypothetical protein [Moraxella equi]MDO5051085.1 hypothetical protein [Moraxella equi]